MIHLLACLALIGFSVWGIHNLELPFLIGLAAGAGIILLYHRWYTGQWFNPMMVDGVAVTEDEWQTHITALQNTADLHPADPPDSR